jgi:hypothetical protein
MEALYIDGAYELVPTGIVRAEGVLRASATGPRRGRRVPPPPDFLEIGDLADHMRGGVAEPEMLVEGWLQRGVLHWLQGQPEHGKSWIPLWLAKQVIEGDRRARVLWMDAEMGSARVADRLVALGADPDLVERRFVHVNLTTVPRDRFAEFVAWVVELRFALVVWDPMAQHLAGADYDENSNSAVAQWLAEMVNPVSAYGGTTVAVDHVSKPTKGTSTAGYARGAGAKKARARIVYEVKRTKIFDRSTIGEIEVWCMKNSDSAAVVRHRSVVLGGTDPFRWKEYNHDGGDAEWAKKQTAQDLKAVVVALEAAGEDGLSQSALAEAAAGNSMRIRALLKRLAAQPGLQDDFGERRIDGGLRRPRKGGKEAMWFWLAS